MSNQDIRERAEMLRVHELASMAERLEQPDMKESTLYATVRHEYIQSVYRLAAICRARV